MRQSDSDDERFAEAAFATQKEAARLTEENATLRAEVARLTAENGQLRNRKYPQHQLP